MIRKIRNKFKNHSFLKSFEYAARGLRDAGIKEPNFKIHLVMAVVAIALAIFLSFTPVEMAILILTVFSVLALELINTAIETVVDIASPNVSEEARIAKDVAASGVLLASIMSIIVGVVLFLPKLIVF